MTEVPREVRRRRLCNLIVHHAAAGRTERVQALTTQLRELPIGGILPEEPRNLLAHCGRWHAVETLPLVLDCCGWVLGEVATETPSGTLTPGRAGGA